MRIKRGIWVVVGMIFLLVIPLAVAKDLIKIAEDPPPHCYPNPFDPDKETTTIVFSVVGKNGDSGNIIIYDFNGRKVWTKEIALVLLSITTNTNYAEVEWGGYNDQGDMVAPGIYFCRITVEAGNINTVIVKIAVK